MLQQHTDFVTAARALHYFLPSEMTYIMSGGMSNSTHSLTSLVV